MHINVNPIFGNIIVQEAIDAVNSMGRELIRAENAVPSVYAIVARRNKVPISIIRNQMNPDGVPHASIVVVKMRSGETDEIIDGELPDDGSVRGPVLKYSTCTTVCRICTWCSIEIDLVILAVRGTSQGRLGFGRFGSWTLSNDPLEKLLLCGWGKSGGNSQGSQEQDSHGLHSFRLVLLKGHANKGFASV